MYKKDLALNNLQGLICYKTRPNTCRIYTLSYKIQIYFSTHFNSLSECNVLL